MPSTLLLAAAACLGAAPAAGHHAVLLQTHRATSTLADRLRDLSTAGPGVERVLLYDKSRVSNMRLRETYGPLLSNVTMFGYDTAGANRAYQRGYPRHERANALHDNPELAMLLWYRSRLLDPRPPPRFVWRLECVWPLRRCSRFRRPPTHACITYRYDAAFSGPLAALLEGVENATRADLVGRLSGQAYGRWYHRGKLAGFPAGLADAAHVIMFLPASRVSWPFLSLLHAAYAAGRIGYCEVVSSPPLPPPLTATPRPCPPSAASSRRARGTTFLPSSSARSGTSRAYPPTSGRS